MDDLVKFVRVLVILFVLTIFLAGTTLLIFSYPELFISSAEESKPPVTKTIWWTAPDTTSLPHNEEGNQIRYGRNLIARTAFYLGPEGTVKSISNGMNCQNCHPDAGTRVFGNNFGSVSSLYPKFRARSGGKESIEKRINDCFERSLNGQTIDSLSREMRAMVAYLHWLGKDVPKGKPAAGASLVEMEWLKRAANPVAGKMVYESKCQLCHAANGEGMKVGGNSEYLYPPLWGVGSFNTAAGQYRISNFARYVKANMPVGATFENPALTDEEAWDVAAYVISMPRPDKRFAQDWPKLELKPVDHPFGPFADKYSEERHKYGPFEELEKRRN